MPAKKAPKEEVAHKFSVGDQVLGRIKGYPPWPARIVAPETEFLTKEVLKQKPRYNAFLVRYYDDANFSWSAPKELKPLSKREIEDFLADGKKAKASLQKAYKTALDPEKWEAEHLEHVAEAKDAAAKRAANADELADSDEEGEAAASKKRKRKSEGKKEANGKKAKGKRGKADHSEDELAEKPAKKAKTANPDDDIPANKQCKEWRRELQKGFLTKDMPKPDEMPQFDKIFTDIEAYNDKAEYLENHKLPKVVKRIASLADGKIPRDDEFRIKARATEIVNKWQQLFHPNGVPAGTKDEDDEKPAENGAKPDDAMQVDEPASAKEVEAAADATAAAEKVEVPVPAEPAPVAELEKPVQTDAASTAIDTTGEPVAPAS